MADKVSYEGKVIFITGGGTGLGLACAKRYCSLGGQVCISGRRENVLEKACEEVRKEIPGAKIFGVGMDVRDPKLISDAVDKIVAKTGTLPHVVLNNAAGNFIAPTKTLTPNAFRSIIDIVLMGTIFTSVEIGKRWIAEREKNPDGPQAVFMTVGTSYVGTGQPYLAPSAAAKAGAWSMTQSLAQEWGPYNMRFFMISPGPIYTEGAWSRLDPDGMISAMADDKKQLSKIVPLARFGSQEEYARFTSYLTSDACSWLTGTNVHFDGGSQTGGGEFQILKMVPDKMWNKFEKKIRAKNATDKAQRSKL